jgi:hypothetical protein
LFLGKRQWDFDLVKDVQAVKKYSKALLSTRASIASVRGQFAVKYFFALAIPGKSGRIFSE